MFILFWLFWIILNGALTAETALIGLLVSGLVFAFTCKFMHYSVAKDKAFMRKAGKFVALLLVLLWEILKADFALLPYVFGAKKINPSIVRFQTPELKTEAAKAMLADCITLTPGTITASLNGDEFLVHCIDREMGEGIDESSFVDCLKKWEEK